MTTLRCLRGAGCAALFAAAASLPAAAPRVYSTAQAKDHVGEYASVCGVLERVYTARTGMEFLDFDGRYPDAPFTAVVFAKDASAVGDLSGFEGKRVVVTGKIAEYKDKPEIVIRRADAIKPAP